MVKPTPKFESFTHKTLQTKANGQTYSYYISPQFHKLPSSTPTLVFLHGYPDDAPMWAGVIENFDLEAYPILAVDILGLGKSSKSTEYTNYNYKPQADSIAEILDAEGITASSERKIIPIGHDWGSATSQRLYLYHRDRCVGLTLISLAYQIPSAEIFDLDQANAATTKRFGYPQWEYWNFFTAPDAADLMNAAPEKLFEINHGFFPSPKPEENGRDIWMREMFCTPGAMREYVEEKGRWEDGKSVEMKPYAQDPEFRRQQVERLRANGLDGPVCYYHTLKNNSNLDDEKGLIPTSLGGRADKDLRQIHVPVLFIGQTGDWVCRTDLMGDAKNEGLLLEGVDERVVDAGHWVMYEKPDEIAQNILEWLHRKFPVKK